MSKWHTWQNLEPDIIPGMNKTIIKSLNSGNFLILDDYESGKEGYHWTNDCNKASTFESDDEACNCIKKHGFVNVVVDHCSENFGQNSGWLPLKSPIIRPKENNMDSNENFIDREKRKHHKKTSWEKSDKLNHQRKTAYKRTVEEIEDEQDEDWKQYGKWPIDTPKNPI